MKINVAQRRFCQSAIFSTEIITVNVAKQILALDAAESIAQVTRRHVTHLMKR